MVQCELFWLLLTFREWVYVGQYYIEKRGDKNLPSHDESDVGSRIRKIRTERGLPLRALADKCSLSVNAISLIERGENSPTVSSLHKLALALDVLITDFFIKEIGLSVVHI